MKPLWAHQVRAVSETLSAYDAGERELCVTSPTGSGKTRIIAELIQTFQDRGIPCVVYTNRRLLIDQLVDNLREFGIRVGVRAAGYETDFGCPVQVSSLATEDSRVFGSGKWFIHGEGRPVIAFIDEAHLNKADTALRVTDKHLEDGGARIGFTATPVNLAHMYKRLIVAAQPSELRKAGCIVPCVHIGVDEPDMSRFAPSVKTGEYREGDIVKAIMTKNIFGRVDSHLRKLNPNMEPTILFGPDVRGSLFFAENLTKVGIRAAHIDGEGAWVDGEYSKSIDRNEILNEVRKGSITVLCNRFVAREGLDLPEVSHIIGATVFGSVQTYIQSVGRGGRACDGKTQFVFQDHGGAWHRHGSVNADRDWTLDGKEHIIAAVRAQRFRDKLENEPIRCPKCGAIRSTGAKCLRCGFEHQKSSRLVVQQDGTLVEHTGDIYHPRRVKMKDNTADIWKSCYFRAKNSRNGMTFNQAEALFFRENYYYPPRDLPFMPISDLDWFRKVKDVPVHKLTGTVSNTEIPWGQLV